MKKIITYGTYDLFHEGHYNLLKNAKALGDYLIVGITSSDFDKNRGKLNVRDSLMTRIKHVEETGFADEVIVEEYFGQKIDDIKKYNIDVFTVGSDWTGHFDYLNEYCEVIYLPRTKGVSSTILRNQNTVKIGIWGAEQITFRFIDEAKFVSGIEVSSLYVDYDTSYKSELLYVDGLELVDSEEEFFKNIDAVYLSAPPVNQYTVIKRILNHGKHILCEFPVLMNKEELQNIRELVSQKHCIFMEGIKTAYTPAFGKLVSLAKSGIIGNIISVDANFTQINGNNLLKQIRIANGGSVNALASYPFLAFIKLLGTDYLDIQYFSRKNVDNIDIFTKILVRYPKGIASSEVAINAKSEGTLTIAGDKGYIYVPAPWWKTEYFEVRFENVNDNRKYFYKFDGEGLRYEIAEFGRCILNKTESILLTFEEISCIAALIDKYNSDSVISI